MSKLFIESIKMHQNDAIFVQPICDLFQINGQNQVRLIKKDPILSKEWTKKSDEFAFGDNHLRICLTKKGFVRWIQIINPNIVASELREKLENFQTFVFDYIYGDGLLPNIHKIYHIDIQIKRINKEITERMLELKQLKEERKSLEGLNYLQLGLNFPDERKTNSNLRSFAISGGQHD
jgi:hypothetical protein